MSILSYLRPKSAIYVVNESTAVPDGIVRDWCKAVQLQIKRDVAPAWGKPAKTVRFLGKFGYLPKNAWVVAVLDDADQAGALGYHSVDDKGRVYGRVFVKTALQYGYSPSQTFSHEVLETFGDPSANDWAVSDSGYSVPVELCDAVENGSYRINGVDVSDFLFPNWFVRGATSGTIPEARLNYLGTIQRAFTLDRGGYTVRQYPSGKVDQVFGDRANVEYVGAKSHEMGRASKRWSKAGGVVAL